MDPLQSGWTYLKMVVAELRAKRLGVPLLGQIPISQDIMEATDSGKPIIEVYPASHISEIYKEIARKVIDQINV